MSGELKDPKVSIPRGTLSAIGVSFVIYVGLAIWFTLHISPQGLIENTSVVIELGRWKTIVILGIMGATMSSALGMFVGAPRALLALSRHSIVPFSNTFSKINKNGEPTGAILLTALLALIAILFGTLNSVASLLTMFFLITYGMINLSVFIEQSIGIVSFRPTFRVSRIIPLSGCVGCLVVMFLIDARFSLIALSVITIIFLVLLKRESSVYSPDVRSGLLVFMAERLARAAAALPYHPKIWKPNFLVPLDQTEHLGRFVKLVHDVTFPSGRVYLFKVVENNKNLIEMKDQWTDKLKTFSQPLKESGLFVETAVVESCDFLTGAITTMQALKGKVFPPNTLFTILSDDLKFDFESDQLIRRCVDEGLGIVLLCYYQKMGLSQEAVINLWIRKQSPNIDLSILVALQLKKNWDGKLRILQSVRNGEEVQEAKVYLEKLKTVMRLPLDVEIEILQGEFREVLQEAPLADINIFGMQNEPDLKMVREVVEVTHTSVLFLRDSKHESAVA